MATWVAAIGVVGGSMAMFAARREGTVKESAPQPARYVSEWRQYAPDTTGGHAPVTIVEFSDFECPFCGKTASAVRHVQQKYVGQVRIIYRHFPLRIHAAAIPAAIAAECARAQGMFWPYHDALFADQDALPAHPWARIAADVHMPQPDVFTKCLASDGPKRTVRADVVAGRRLGLDVTPSLLINDSLVIGGQTPASLEQRVVRMLQHNRGEIR